MTKWLHDAATLERLRTNFSALPGRKAGHDGLARAAVAVALVPSPQGSAFLLTRRPGHLPRHSGQYALPGGRLDPGETAEVAARRELAEELGVEAGSETVLGRLDDLPTASGWRITPVVLWLGEVRLDPDPGEVEEVFIVPLADLFARPDRQAPERIAPEPGVFWMFIPTLGHEVYAPTAAILRQFREVALLGREARMLTFREPRFARR